MDRLIEFRLGENYSRAELNTWHVFKVIRSNIEIPITPPLDGAQIWYSQYITFKVKVNGQSLRVKGQGHSVS